MAEPPEPAPGLFGSVKRLGQILLAIAQNRLELLLVEMEEERHRAAQAILLIVAAGTLALMTLMVTTWALVIVFWEHRLVVLVILGVVYASGTIGVYWKLSRMRNNWTPFSATVAELKKDKAWLEQNK
jgi:uncharacterized membrane protein YqjE